MADCQTLLNHLQTKFAPQLKDAVIKVGELTIEVDAQDLLEVCKKLRDDPDLRFEMLVDLCGVDYLEYGLSEWETDNATSLGFSRGVEPLAVQSHCVGAENEKAMPKNEKAMSNNQQMLSITTETLAPTTPCWTKPRFAVVYHLLSLSLNQRLRLRTFAQSETPKSDISKTEITKDETPIVPSVIKIWNSANWYEREAFDLYGILFDGHPDLRRILTDYGFIGYPFRKDFPLIGTVEMRYSAENHRVIYEPVSIAPRTLVPKTIRDDNRYLIEKEYHAKERQENEKVLHEKGQNQQDLKIQNKGSE